MTKAGRSAIAVIVDRSGSMGPIAAPTIEAYNEFLRSQKALPGECLFTTVLFDHEVETLHESADIQSVPELNGQVYFARGSTSLYDAVGMTIQKLGAALAAMSEEDRPEKVLVVIQTDGEENTSKEYTDEQVIAMISHQREVYGWDFLFLGAAQDAWSGTIGRAVGAQNTLSYGRSAGQTRQAFDQVAAYATTTRGGGHAVLTSTDIRGNDDDS